MKKFLTREIMVYLIFGVLTTVVSYVVYFLCNRAGMNLVLSNTVSTVVGVLFAFVTNKIWVFESQSFRVSVAGPEFLKFSSGRVVTYLIETALLVLIVNVMRVDKQLAKGFTLVVVVVLNYFISKKAVFVKKKNP